MNLIQGQITVTVADKKRLILPDKKLLNIDNIFIILAKSNFHQKLHLFNIFKILCFKI